jgi:hypothetical protein
LDGPDLSYRRDVLSFVDFLGITWPHAAFRLLLASVACREQLKMSAS